MDRFMKASMKGLAWSVENPKGAIDIFLKSAPTNEQESRRGHLAAHRGAPVDAGVEKARHRPHDP